MPLASANGRQIHHRLDGPSGAPVVVLSHSLGTDMGLWDLQLPALAARHRVLRYDCRGHGASPVVSGTCAIEDLARDALGLLDALGVARASFCGLSLGGMVGMWLGASAPERVARLVLCNNSARVGPPAIWDGRIAAVRAGGMASVAEAVLGRWFTPEFLARRPPEVEAARRMLLATPPEGYAACCAAIRDMDQREAVARVRAPTLVVAGSLDQATPPADGRFLAGRIGGAGSTSGPPPSTSTSPPARYLELPAAHLSNLEAPGPFTAALVEFLGEEE